MNVKLYLQQEKIRLEQAIEEDRAYLDKAPAGSLVAKPVGKNFAWLRKNIDNAKKRSTYIRKKDRKLAEALVAKGYVEAKIYDELADLKAADLYLSHCAEPSKVEKYMGKNAEYQRLLKPYLMQHDKDVEAWLAKRYTGPQTHPEELTKLTRAGYYVRSKSEQMIVAHLVRYGVPHKYEQRLFVNDHDLYPDFMIMNPRTHKVYIWEHFGMMDDENYREHNSRKVEDYASLGYLLGDNLIFTFETKESGLDEIFAEKIVEHYFT